MVHDGSDMTFRYDVNFHNIADIAKIGYSYLYELQNWIVSRVEMVSQRVSDIQSTRLQV